MAARIPIDTAPKIGIERLILSTPYSCRLLGVFTCSTSQAIFLVGSLMFASALSMSSVINTAIFAFTSLDAMAVLNAPILPLAKLPATCRSAYVVNCRAWRAQ
ncbi:hypothetical protein D3C86_1984500 [compost metagenome]